MRPAEPRIALTLFSLFMSFFAAHCALVAGLEGHCVRGAPGCTSDVESSDVESSDGSAEAEPDGGRAGDAGEVVIVAANAGSTPWALALDSDNVYWTNKAQPGSVMMCPVTGCPAGAVTIASNQGDPTSIVVRGDSVYWTASGDGTVMTKPIRGSDAGAHVLASLRESPGSLAVVSATQLFWTEPTRVARCELSGNRCATDPLTGGNEGSPTGLVSDGTDLFWGQNSQGGGIRTCPVSGCVPDPVTLASTQNAPSYVAVDATSVYWTNRVDDGSVMAAPKTGIGSGTATTLASGQPQPAGIYVDGAHVYWTTLGTQKNGFKDGTVMRADKSGKNQITLAKDQAAPMTVVVDAMSKFVYFTSSGDGSVKRVQNP